MTLAEELANEYFAQGYLVNRGIVKQDDFERLIRARCALAINEAIDRCAAAIENYQPKGKLYCSRAELVEAIRALKEKA